MENFLMINGKKIELTDEQVKHLTETADKKSPFERVKKSKPFYILTPCDEVSKAIELLDDDDEKLYQVANYCTDKELMKQRALHETLDRLLWRFSCESGELENEWNSQNSHYLIVWDFWKNDFAIITNNILHKFSIYFPTEKIAQRAIDEIVKPFMAEHPEFVW